jgi:predicted HTH transcriptional regulator
MFMNIELSKKNLGKGMALFALLVAFADPLLGLFFLVLTAAVLLFWHRHEERGNLGHFSQIHSAQKLENLMQVLELARSKNEISNDDVEKALGVSDATAERYLNDLQARGLVEQIGTTGRGVIYRPTE